jgi:hypothetical protein
MDRRAAGASEAGTRHSRDSQQQEERAAGRSGQRTTKPARSFRKLDTSPTQQRPAGGGTVARRHASASISLFGATRHGVFEQPRHVRDDAWESVSQKVAQRRNAGEPSIQEALEAADALPDIDRSGFGVLAKESLEQRPKSAGDIYRANASRVVANRAQQLTSEQREAGITLAAARPEVVSAALASDYRAWGHGYDEPPPRSPYDEDLFDRQGGLERFREKFEGKRAGAQGKPPDDEGLPF